MRALIVEDEIFARERVKKLLGEVEWVDEILESENGATAVTEINTRKPDLVFLDVNLQDMTGFDVLQQIEIDPKPLVIFVTAHDFYAQRAFDFEAFDFLLKPFKNERFFKAMDKISQIPRNKINEQFDARVMELIKLHESQQNKQSSNQKLPIKLGNKTILIDVESIHYITASGYYAEIFTEGNKYLIRESLSNLNELLNPDRFFRVHRSHIVNFDYIQEIVHSDYSEIDIRMKDKKLIRVSKSQKKEFLKKLGLK